LISPALEQLIKPATRVQQMLWATLTASLLVYVAVAYVAARPEEAREIPANMTLALALIACAIAALASRIPAVLLSDDKLRALLTPEPSPEELAKNPQTGKVHPERQREIEALPVHEQRLLRLPAAAFVPFIARLVLNESIGIFGLVLSFLSHRFEPVLPFALAAIVLNLLARPNLRALLQRGAHLVR
jgi:hypothetical protein